MDNIETRLLTLEKNLRFYKALTLLVIFALISVFLVSAAGGGIESVVRTKKLEIVDSYGKVRAELEIVKKTVILTLYDEKYNKRVILNTDTKHTALNMLNEYGTSRASIAIINRNPLITFTDGGGKDRLVMGFKVDKPLIKMIDNSGERKLEMLIDNRGPSMEMQYRKSKIGMGVGPDGPDVGYYDNAGKRVFHYPEIEPEKKK